MNDKEIEKFQKLLAETKARVGKGTYTPDLHNAYVVWRDGAVEIYNENDDQVIVMTEETYDKLVGVSPDQIEED